MSECLPRAGVQINTRYGELKRTRVCDVCVAHKHPSRNLLIPHRSGVTVHRMLLKKKTISPPSLRLARLKVVNGC